MKTLVLSGVMLALGLVLAIVVWSNQSARVETEAERARAEAEARAALAAELAKPPGGTGSALDPIEGAQEPARATAQAATTAGPELTLRGRVTCATTCGFDDLEVFVLAEPLAGTTLDSFVDEPDGQGSKASFVARVRAALDGTFQASLPADTRKVWVSARGRYVYSSGSLEVDPRSNEPVSVLASCGACIEGHVRAAEGAPPVTSTVTIELASAIEALARGAVEARIDRKTHVRDGKYVFQAVPAQEGVTLAVASDVHPALEMPITELAPGRTRTTDVQLSRGGTLVGRVVGPDGSGVALAQVRALRPGRWFGFDDKAAREGQTADDGSFKLEAVALGTLRLTAAKDGLIAGEPLELQVVDGAVHNGLVVELGLGNSIQGTVTWPDGRPAVDVPVAVEFDKAQLYGMSAFGAARGAEGSARTDAAGAFVVHGLGVGPFSVEAQAPPPTTAGEATTSEKRQVLHRARMDDVKPNARGVALVLTGPIVVSGRVVDMQGAPVPKFSILAQSVGKGMLKNLGQEHERERVDDPSGAFQLELQKPGDWELFVEADLYATSEAFALTLPRASDAPEIVIRLERGARVRGLVQDPFGLPVAGAEVELSTGEPAWMRAGSRLAKKSARSEANGTFLLTDLRGGALRLVASAKGFARSLDVPVNVAAGAEYADVVLVLRVGGRLTGEVFDGGRAASGMLVQATFTGTMDQSVGFTDSSGRFEIEHLVPGSYQIVAMRTGPLTGGEEGATPDAASIMSQLKMASAEIVDGQDTHVVLGAPPADPVHVHGRVTHGGEPYADAMIVFFGESKDMLAGMKTATVAKDGGYAVDLDAPGRYSVTVQRVSGKPGEQTSTEFQRMVPSAKDHVLDFVMPNGRISGRVLGPDGAPAAAVAIAITNEDGRAARSMFGGQFVMSSTDAEGRYDLQALRPGNYTVSAGGSAFGGLLGEEKTFGRASKKRLRLVDGGWLKDVDFRLEKPGEVRVTVVGSDGQAVPEASLFARDADGQLVEALSMLQTGVDGTARYTGLSPGKYTFSARTQDLASGDSPTIEVESGATRDVRITLAQGTVLIVRVLGHDGEPAEAQLFVFDAAGRDVASMLGASEMQKLFMQGDRNRDEHRIGPLPAGKYRARAVRVDGKVLEKPLSLSGQKERTVTLEFED